MSHWRLRLEKKIVWVNSPVSRLNTGLPPPPLHPSRLPGSPPPHPPPTLASAARPRASSWREPGAPGWGWAEADSRAVGPAWATVGTANPPPFPKSRGPGRREPGSSPPAPPPPAPHRPERGGVTGWAWSLRRPWGAPHTPGCSRGHHNLFPNCLGFRKNSL